MLDFKEVASYLLFIVSGLGLYIWQSLNNRVMKLEKNQASILSEEKIDLKINRVKNDVNHEITGLKTSLDRLIEKMEYRHKRFEKIEDKFEKFLDSRQDFHDHLTKITQNIGTKDELMRVIDSLEKINNNIGGKNK